MKKNYSTPEAKSLEVMAQDIICVSGGNGAPKKGQIGSMGKTPVVW